MKIVDPDLERLANDAYVCAHIAALMIERSLSHGEKAAEDTRTFRLPDEDVDAVCWIAYEARRRAKVLYDRVCDLP